MTISTNDLKGKKRTEEKKYICTIDDFVYVFRMTVTVIFNEYVI